MSYEEGTTTSTATETTSEMTFDSIAKAVFLAKNLARKTPKVFVGDAETLAELRRLEGELGFSSPFGGVPVEVRPWIGFGLVVVGPSDEEAERELRLGRFALAKVFRVLPEKTRRAK